MYVDSLCILNISFYNDNLLKCLLDLLPSFRDKQESLEFLPWLVVYNAFT